jgi:hypothetical protein
MQRKLFGEKCLENFVLYRVSQKTVLLRFLVKNFQKNFFSKIIRGIFMRLKKISPKNTKVRFFLAHLVKFFGKSSLYAISSTNLFLLISAIFSLWGAFHVLAFNSVLFLAFLAHLRAMITDPGIVPMNKNRYKKFLGR